MSTAGIPAHCTAVQVERWFLPSGPQLGESGLDLQLSHVPSSREGEGGVGRGLPSLGEGGACNSIRGTEVKMTPIFLILLHYYYN